MKISKILIIVLVILSSLLAQDKRKIGLIPFENKSGDSRYDWISYGFEYFLYNKLAVLSGFYVPEKKNFHQLLQKAGSSKGIPDDKTIMSIGHASGVEVLVCGYYTVQRSQLQLTVMFFNAFNGQLILENKYTNSLRNFFATGQRLVNDLIALAGINVTPTERVLLNFSITRSITAYGSFIRAYMENEKPHPRNEMVIGLFKKAIREDPKFWEAYYNLGIVYFNSARYQQALEQFNKVIQALPNFDKPYFGRGLIYEKQKEYQKAVADFKKVVELNPNDYKAYYYLGKIHVIRAEYKQAEEMLIKARKLNPEFAPTYYEMGNIYYNQNKYRRCIEFYKNAVKYNDQNALYHLKLGDAYYRSQIYYNALNEINASLAINPNNANAYFLKGITIYKQAVLEDLIKAFLDLLSGSNQSSSNSDEKVVISDPVKRERVYTDMAEAFSQAIRVRPNFMEATFNLALTYDEKGDYNQAERFYLRTLQLNPNLVRAHMKLAELYTKTGRKQQAIKQYEKLFYVDPAFFVVHPTLGPEFQYINVYKQFRKDLEKKLQDDPNNPRYNLVLAKIFWAQGYKGKAANLLRKVLKFNPSNQDARKLLKKIEKNNRY